MIASFRNRATDTLFHGIDSKAARTTLPPALQRVNTPVNGKRDMTAETAVLLSRVLKISAQFWMNLQTARDLYKATQNPSHAA